MFKIGIDTSTWRHWFDLQMGALDDSQRTHRQEPSPKENAEAFHRIYHYVAQHPSEYNILYSRTVVRELEGEGYADHFADIFSQSFIVRISEGVDRWDDNAKTGDGGTLGYVPYYDVLKIHSEKDSLRAMLNLSGHNHEAALKTAIPDRKTPNSLHTKERRKEFDIIILEGCLTVADIFLTDDMRFTRKLRQASRELPENPSIKEAIRICFYPVNAFETIQRKSLLFA